ncbi:MAG: leucine--tRNA ligase [Chloroflexi bacterium]|nr:leucine--tRNA ligase [Chloroflexota bacterium]
MVQSPTEHVSSETERDGYDPRAQEARWAAYWNELNVDRVIERSGTPKFYCLDMFPYPSGAGLSVGHCHNYVPTDVISRYMRMRGYNVLHPMGWDAFGQPAENEAIRTGQHPRTITELNTANYRRQLQMIGTSYDWSREIDSSNPQYYRWTQWFFLLLYKRGLAYRAMAAVWWCPSCKTTLANEEVHNGRCWRCDSLVERREMAQWFFRITTYAGRLLDDLKKIDWPDSVKAMQENWIGRSEGTLVHFSAEDGTDLPIFTTRPDTLFGCTFFVLAPEHPLVADLTSSERQAEVAAYVAQTRRTTEIERTSTVRERTGVPIGASAINPVNGERVPIWVADYVLPTYGTGMIMAVPAHDDRDFSFAQRYGLPIRPVVAPPGFTPGESLETAFTGDGVLISSGEFSGIPSAEAKRRIVGSLESRGLGQAQVNYKLRDWLISRQRYWGAPIPIIHCPVDGEVPVPEEQLPVQLPDLVDWQPTGTGRSPLETATEWVNTRCPKCGRPARRETDTMGGFACSSWYFLRFCSPADDEHPFDPKAVGYWMPVDLYVGGLEHAVMHLLYARFWTKVMFDAGLVSFDEPFTRYRPQGVVHSPLPDKAGVVGKRMSKSKGNVITPDSVVEANGADALRIYELFIGPFDQNLMWDQKGINGVYRFLSRVWEIGTASYTSSGTQDDDRLRRSLHKCIKKVGEDIQEMRFNTAVSALMIFVNELHDAYRQTSLSEAVFSECINTLILMLAPMAVFLAEELWHQHGGAGSVHLQSWPAYQPELTEEATVEIAVQVNSKLRDRIRIPVAASEAEVQEIALQAPKVSEYVTGKQVQKVFYAPGRLLNIIVRER